MSTNSRWWFLDIVLALVLTAVGGGAAYTGLDGRLRVALVLPLVVFLPGYVLVSALFPTGVEGEGRSFRPGKTDASYELGGPERVALGATLSVAVVPMIAAIANFTPWGVRMRPILFGIVGFTVVFGVIALARRGRVPMERRYSPGAPNLLFSSHGRRSSSGTTMVLNVGLVISVLLLASSLGFAMFNPPQGKTFTEFYANTNQINSKTNTMYQTNLADDGVTVNIHNHEREQVQYTVVAIIQRVEGGSVVKQSQFDEQQVTVDAGKKKQVTLTGDPAFTGDNVRVRLLLYKGSPSGEPYREIRMWVSSSAPPKKGETVDQNTSKQTTTPSQTTQQRSTATTTQSPQTTTVAGTTTSAIATTTSSETTTQPGRTTTATTTTRTTTRTAATTTSSTSATTSSAATATTTTTDGGGILP